MEISQENFKIKLEKDNSGKHRIVLISDFLFEDLSITDQVFFENMISGRADALEKIQANFAEALSSVMRRIK